MSAGSTDVRFWEVRRRSTSIMSWEVRWVVGGRTRSRSRRTKGLAEAYLSELRAAARRGESFDVRTGLPISMQPPPDATTWLSFVQEYVDVKWPRAAAKTRDSLTDALATVTAALVDTDAGSPGPQMVRTVLRQHLLPPAGRDLPGSDQMEAAARWLTRHSVPMSELTSPRVLRVALEALTVTLDGRPAAATTIRRKRAVFHNALQYAVETEALSVNNLGRLGWRAPAVTEVVDRRVVVNPRQAEELLTAVTYAGPVDRGRHLRGFFACLYYAGLRPAEARDLRATECQLPGHGWGQITVVSSRPESNRRWSDTGSAHERRGLKHRGAGATRPVPVPPRMVQILREHLAEFGTAADGRLFQTRRGGVLGDNYTELWAQARRYALTPTQVASPLADRPYALRHAAVSLWLNAGVPATEVAQRAGHGVDVLLRVYAKCLDGSQDLDNRRIESTLHQLGLPAAPDL